MAMVEPEWRPPHIVTTLHQGLEAFQFLSCMRKNRRNNFFSDFGLYIYGLLPEKDYVPNQPGQSSPSSPPSPRVKQRLVQHSLFTLFSQILLHKSS